MKLARFAVNNPVLINMIMILIVAGGVVSYFSLPQNLFPEVEINWVQVTTIYPGASPEEVEKLVTIPIEEKLQDVDGVKNMVSTSAEGLSSVFLELYLDTDLRVALEDTRTRLDQVQDLPSDAERPVASDIPFEQTLIQLAVAGDASEMELRRAADLLEERVMRIPGVGTIGTSGRRDREIWVQTDPDRLLAQNLTVADVANAIRAHNLNIPGGVMETKSGERILRTVGESLSARTLRELPVGTNPAGGVVTLNQVADVGETFEKARTLGRAEGKPAIILNINKKTTGNASTIVEKIRKVKEETMSEMPPGIQIYEFSDLSTWIKSRLQTMIVSGIQALIFVLIILMLFLNWRMAIWTAMGIPIAFLGAYILMNMFGLDTNLMSLFSLILVLGIVVDDAIVVCENVYRHLQEGLPVKEAAIKGTGEVIWPVIAAVSTTIAAFLPMLLATGVMGNFLSVIPKVVTFALLVSLIEALLILPSHLADFGVGRGGKKVEMEHKMPGWFRAMRRTYQGLLVTALKWRYAMVTLMLVGTVGVVGVAMKYQPFILFHVEDVPFFFVQAEGPKSWSLEDTEEVIRQLEEKVAALPRTEVKAFTSSVGFVQTDQVPTFGENLGQVMVEMDLFENGGRTMSSAAVIKMLRESLSTVEGPDIKIIKAQGGPPVGKAVNVVVRGNDLDTVMPAVEHIRATLETMDGIEDISTNQKEGKPEIRITPNLQKAAVYGLDTRTIGLAVLNAYQGVEATSMRDGKDEIKVVVKFPEDRDMTPAELLNLRLRSRSGELIPLGAVAAVETVPGASSIRHRNQKVAVTVSSDVDNVQMTSAGANQVLKEKYGLLPKQFPGVSLEYSGENEDTQESLRSILLATPVAFLAVFAILAIVFKSFSQPLVIMATIPFSIGGVFIGFFVLNIPIGLLTLIGMVALMGVVVNDSLIVVEFINKSRAAGMGRWRALVRAGVVRFRPVILTTMTTIFGLLPLSTAKTGQAAYLAPLAISLSWGLAFATILTLVMIPSMYAIREDLTEFLTRPLRRLKRPRAGDRIEVPHEYFCLHLRPGDLGTVTAVEKQPVVMNPLALNRPEHSEAWRDNPLVRVGRFFTEGHWFVQVKMDRTGEELWLPKSWVKYHLED